MRIKLLLAIFILALISTANAEEITSCQIIDSPGYYVLANDIINSSETYCIQIASSDVIFDGNGHLIDGVGSGYGIYVYGSTFNPYTNITVKNVTVTDWNYGIYFYGVSNGSIIGSTAVSNGLGISIYSSNNITIAGNSANQNRGDGIRVYSSNNNTIANNNASLNDVDGIYLYSSENNTVAYNNASSCNTGIYIYYSSNNSVTENEANSNSWYGVYIRYSDNNFVGSNSMKRCKQGLYLNYADSNIVAANIISSNSWDGMYIAYSEKNTVASNEISANGRHGIWLYSSNNNTLLRNKIEDNGESDNGYGIYFSSSASNLIYNNIFSNENNVGFSATVNSWNVTKTEHINIAGGPYMGGNYWSGPDGYSDACSDADNDGICDIPYKLDEDNIDYLPLTVQSQTYILTISPNPESSIIEEEGYRLDLSVSAGKGVMRSENYVMRLTAQTSGSESGIEKHFGPIEPVLLSCDYAGFEKNYFAPGERIYAEGWGLRPNTEYRIWVQPDPVNEGDDLDSSNDPSGYQELVVTDENGNFGPVCIWSVPRNAQTTAGEWDIIADMAGGGEGVYDAFDEIDSATTSGFVAPISEMLTFVLACLGAIIVIAAKRL